ncbi:MAG: TIGR01212 family radical SAM protein [Bacteroidaceae bacterium]
MSDPILYHDFRTFLAKYFAGKVQKISINAGFSCPNRDGVVGVGGCTYCNNQTFNPAYCQTNKSITEQLKEGKAFFARKYPEMKYLAYFQAYTNTYDTVDRLMNKYTEALEVTDVVGVVIGTRPDCVSDTLLDAIAELRKKTFVLMEYGIESASDKTLWRINRGHTFAQTIDAVQRTAKRQIPVGGHLILGLPGETREELIAQAHQISALPLEVLKLHQLQLIRGTRMAQEFQENPTDFSLLYNKVDDYIDLVIDYIAALRPDLVIERFTSQSPRSLLVAPDWGLKNYELVAKLQKRMKERNMWQGKYAKNE